MEAPVWFCGAPADPVADGLARRVAGLGLEVAASPSGADRAVVVLSPGLAAADPPDLRAWVSDRGVDGLVLAVSDGGAGWDEEADRFVSGEGADAVPAALREEVRQRPFVMDVRAADDAKLDRCARRIAGAVSTSAAPVLEEPGVAADGKRRPLAIAAVALGVLLIGALAVLLLGGEGSGSGTSTDTSVRTSTPTTGRIPSTTGRIPSTTGRPGPTTAVRPGVTTTVRPATTVAATSESDSNLNSWIIIVVLAGALAVTLVMLKRRPKVAPAPARSIAPSPSSTPPPVASGAPLVFISHDTEADGPVARELGDQLRRRQLEAWIAPDSIPPGEPWVFAIEQGLVTSRAALVLVSPAALASGWVRREIQMIVDLEIDGRLTVVPVRVAPCEVPLLLTAYQWVDVGDFDRAADSLARRFAAATATGSTGAG
ncbi:MAG: toll/interleukin-1 receptor domain-containing protein [Acidimicrobiales bacterium]